MCETSNRPQKPLYLASVLLLTMYEDDEEQEEGPKSSFSTYLAEGDVLYKQGEYKKALDSYSLVGSSSHHYYWALTLFNSSWSEVKILLSIMWL